METLTETVITDSSMIGHNPSTPAGAGQAVGETLLIENISRAVQGTPYILAASSDHSYEEVAAVVNQHEELDIVGIILQADEAVLVENRIHREIPIIDEVCRIDRLPDGIPAAIEVALPGQTIRMLSNPYGIATLLVLNAEETRTITPDREEPDREPQRGCTENPRRQCTRKCTAGRRDLFLRRQKCHHQPGRRRRQDHGGSRIRR